jgi:uncharacterized OsmC-like protein
MRSESTETSHEPVVTIETDLGGRFTQDVHMGPHRLIADEPASLGGDDEGPSPYQLLLAALGSCTSMTIKMYADRKAWPVERVKVALTHGRIYADDCETCETKVGQIDRITRTITIDGPLDDEQRARLVEIANKCPVHRTLTGEIVVDTKLADPAADAP